MSEFVTDDTGAVVRLREALVRWTGLDCGRGGRDDVLARILRARAAEAGMTSAAAYVATLAKSEPSGTEIQRIVNAITVGYTWFFRDEELLRQVGAHLTRPVRPPAQVPSVWVAGCASGDEAYSLAILAAAAGRRARVVASDINTLALETARAAVYGDWSVRLVPPALQRYLAPNGEGHRRVIPEIRSAVRFTHHNLVEAPLAPPEAAPGWDAIVCRNVLVYFESEAARQTVRRLLGALAEDGLLFVGSGEVAAALAELAEPVVVGGRTGYRRRRGVTARARSVTDELTPSPVPRPTPSPARPVDELLAQGAQLLDGGDIGAALVRFVAAVELDPLSAEARLFVGIAHHATGDSAAAHGPLRAALFLSPDLWLASFYLARVHEALGRPEEARREYQRVIAADTSGEPRGALRLMKGWLDHARSYAQTRS